MKIDVYDTYVTKSGGSLMHLDVLVPKGTEAGKIRGYIDKWLKEIGVDATEIINQRCNYCHSEAANPALTEELSRKPYAILEMEGCPNTIVNNRGY